MPEISFLVLTYNSERFISKLLNSLFKSLEDEIQKEIVEIVIVDNNSEDNTIARVKKFKNITLIENNTNLGFSKGINKGVSNVKAEYVVFLNPDTELREGNILKILERFKDDEKLAVVGGKIIDKNGEDEKSAGRFHKTFEVILMSLGLDEMFGVRNSPNKLQEVDFVSGAFMIIRKKIFDKLSGFDENLFMYVEDMEFCYRAKKAGYKIIFDPDLIICHNIHGSSDRGFAIKNIHRGLLYFQKKHGSKFSFLLTAALLRLKVSLLVIIGKIMNNKYLTNTYRQVQKI